MSNVVIRKAERQDVPLLLEFIKGIARYEKLENEVIASADVLEQEMFDEHRAEAVFAVVDGREVGFALYFYNFSTFIGHSGLYLEDLFVWPEDRGKGYGKALLLHLVRIAREHHCGRMEWTCLNWNQPSIDFYLSLGAVPMKEWTVYRLDAAALERSQLTCTRIPLCVHYALHVLCLCYNLLMRVMTAHLESAGLHFWTISKLVSIEVSGLFIHLLIEVRHLLIIHCNDLVLLAVVILITCHCRHCKCDGHHHGCDHLIHCLHNLVSYSLNGSTFCFIFTVQR